MEKKITINSLADVCSYNVPEYVLNDINKRITDWLASGGTMEDDYIKQQYRYVERYLNSKTKH